MAHASRYSAAKTILIASAIGLQQFCFVGEANAQRYAVLKPIKGSVVDDQGKPVAAAEVHFPFNKQPVTTIKTDAEGKFAYEYRFSGSSSLIVAKSTDGSRQGVFALPWTAKEWNEAEVRIELKPAESVRVKVVDPNSRPIAGAKAGAIVRYQGGHSYKVSGETNADGDAIWNIPSGADSVSFLAFKSGWGLDYANYGDIKEPVKIPSKVTLQLTGAKTFEIDVEDGKGEPLSGVRIHFLAMSKPDVKPLVRDSINLSYFADELRVTSDAQGKFRIDWLPNWSKHLTTFGEKEGYAHGRLDSRLDEETPASKLVMEKEAKVSGKVLTAGGAPAANVEVTLTGQSYDLDGIHKTVLTDAEGRYSFIAAPHHLCMLIARSGNLVSNPVDGLVTDSEKPVEGIELRLGPGIRIFGKVQKEIDSSSDKKATVFIQQIGRKLSDCPAIVLPEPKNQNFPGKRLVQCMVQTSAEANESGEYETYVAAGSVIVMLPPKIEDISANKARKVERLQLTTEKEVEIDFLSSTPAE